MKIDVPATVATAPVQTIPASQPVEGCSCGVPEDAPPPVHQTRTIAMVVIGTHALALAIFGFHVLDTWVGALCAIIAASVLLCCYTKECYACTMATWIVAAIFDLTSAIYWLGTHESLGGGWLSIFSVIALISVIPGIVCACQACTGWADSTSAGGNGSPVVTVDHQAYARGGATRPYMPQQQGPPPPYGADV